MSIKDIKKRGNVNLSKSAKIKGLSGTRQPIWAPQELCRKVQVHAKMYGYPTAAKVVEAGLALLEQQAKALKRKPVTA